MTIEKIFFLILIIVCVFFYILYIGEFSLILLIIVSAVPVWMFISAYSMKKLISVELGIQNKSIPKNQPFNVKLEVSNESIFSCARAEAIISYTNLLSGEKNEIEIYLPVHSRNIENVVFQLTSKFCGIIEVKMEQLTIYDPLKIFKFRICKNIGEKITVLPVTHEISGYILSGENDNEEGNIYSQFRSGDDPSEVFDLREYVGGDKMNRIHWKLSSKKDEFIVKELSRPIDLSAVLFLDMYYEEKNEYTLPVIDTLLETLFSLSEFMLTNEKPHTIVIYNSQMNEFQFKEIMSFEESAAAMNKILKNYNAANKEKASLETFIKTTDRFEFSSFTYISSNPDNNELNLINDYIESDIKNVIDVTNGISDKNYDEGLPINITVVPIGRISSAINDIEL